MLPDSGPRCPRCAAPTDEWDAECLECLDGGPIQNSTTIWGVYDGTLRRALLALKHHGHDELARPLGRRLAAVVATTPWSSRLDTVTWVPTHSLHRVRRGYSAAHLLAREVGGALELPLARLLTRHGLGRQATRSRAQRHALPTRAFAPRRSATGLHVLLVDDVMATGSTIRRACGTLSAAGAVEVHVSVLAVAM